jgi:hypothetical protein
MTIRVCVFFSGLNGLNLDELAGRQTVGRHGISAPCNPPALSVRGCMMTR